jgi:hypothetical protein
VAALWLDVWTSLKQGSQRLFYTSYIGAERARAKNKAKKARRAPQASGL